MQQEADPTSFLRSFLDIGVQLTQELDIGHVLMTIVERSMELTGARYGAALTLTTEGDIEDFLYRGMTPEQVQALPHVPRGEGLLGLVLSERATLSVADISKHSAS